MISLDFLHYFTNRYMHDGKAVTRVSDKEAHKHIASGACILTLETPLRNSFHDWSK